MTLQGTKKEGKDPAPAPPESKPMAFWEIPNAVAIYIIIAAFFGLLMATLSAANWVIGSGHITLITVIAALLLFRYYSTVKLADLLELSNTQKEADKTADAAKKVADKVDKEIKPKVQQLLDASLTHIKKGKELKVGLGAGAALADIDSLLDQHSNTVENLKSSLVQSFDELEKTKDEMLASKAALDTHRAAIAKRLNRF